MTDLESRLRDRLAGLVEDVHVDQRCTSRLPIGQQQLARAKPKRAIQLLAASAAAVVVVLALSLAASTVNGHPSEETYAGPTTALPTWATDALAAAEEPPSHTTTTGLGTIRYDGDKILLFPWGGGPAVEVPGLGDPARSRPQWTANSALLLVRRTGQCPEVAELHPFGAVEVLVRRCDALALSPDGATLLLGAITQTGSVNPTGLLDLHSGTITPLRHTAN